MNRKHAFHIRPFPAVKQSIKHVLTVSVISLILFSGLFATLLVQTNNVRADDDPVIIIENTMHTLLDEFAEKRTQLQGNNSALFDLVNRLASSLFDFNYISRLVLANNWKKANAQQRQAFSHEFKRLIIITYATALFQYTGNETITFSKSKIKEKKGIKFGTVNTEINIGESGAIPVSYSLIQRDDHQWKIYNLTVGSLNMVLNYRNIFQASIRSKGLAEMISSLKSNNNKNYSS